MSSYLYNVRVLLGAGSPIPLAIKEAHEMATLIGDVVTVEDANGVDVKVAPDSCVDDLVTAQRAKQAEQQKRPVVGPYPKKQEVMDDE